MHGFLRYRVLRSPGLFSLAATTILVAVACAGAGKPAQVATPTPPAGQASATAAPSNETSLAGTFWEYEGQIPGGGIARSRYWVLGTSTLRGTQVYVVGSLLEQGGSPVEADVSFAGTDLKSLYGPDGRPLAGAPGQMPDGVATLDGEIETRRVPAGEYQARKHTVSGPGTVAVVWKADGFVKPIRSEVTRGGNTYVEELTNTGVGPAKQAADEFYGHLAAMQSQGETSRRVSALKALASFALFAKRAEVLAMLESAEADPEASVRNTAAMGIQFVRDGVAAWRESPELPGRVTGNAAPSREVMLFGIAMGTIADALGILGAGASVVGGAAATGSDTAVTILHPVGCERGSVAISLDVGDTVANVPFEVNYNLGWARDIGWWDPANLFTLLLPIGGNIIHTYKYELTLKTSGGEASMTPVVGGDGFHLKLTNVPDLFFARRWADQDGPTEDDVVIEASTWMVNRGSHEHAHWWSAADSACQLHFSVFNPFYAMSEDFRPSDKDMAHHITSEHRAEFVLQKRPRGSQFPPPPQGWVIESLEQQSQAKWGYEWRVLCSAAPVIPVQNCQAHAGGELTSGTRVIEPAVIARGTVSPTRDNRSPVSATYMLEGIPHIHHPTGNPPSCSLANNPGFHFENLDCDILTELKATASGTNRLGEWMAENLLQGSSVRDRRLPISKSFVDHDGADAVTPTTGAEVRTPTPQPPSTPTRVASGPLEPASVGPMKAVFNEPGQLTDYSVAIAGFDSNAPYSYKWSGPDCGEFLNTTGTLKEDEGVIKITWKHPHPPCDPTKSHDHVAIRLVVEDASFRYTCTYPGARTGEGPVCVTERK